MIPWLLAALLLSQGMGTGRKRVETNQTGRAPDVPRFVLRDLTAGAGLTAQHRYGDGTSRHILSMTGNGVAVVDFDNDGDADLLFADGRAPVLYRNDGAGRFADVSAQSGFLPRPWGQGVCAGDYDNDGWTDVLLTYYGASRLYRNERGRFRDVTAEAGLPQTGARFSTGCAFLDYDRDGRLDLVIANYVVFDLAAAPPPGATKYCTWLGLKVFCGPRGFPGDQPLLYHQEGGSFRDVTATAMKGVTGLHYGLGVATADFDGDGWTDIYIACDSTPGILLRNNRDGTLTDVAVEAGAAYGADGETLGSMGVAVLDVDGDGRLDLLKTNFVDETPSLYRNLGDWFFVDATRETGWGRDATAVGWGVGVMDFDHDGWPDVFMANGHIYPELGAAYRQPKTLGWNRQGVFASVRAGTPAAARGLAVGDLDGDGVVEAVVTNLNAAPAVYRVDVPQHGNSLAVRLEGTRSNRNGIGTRVRVTANGRTQTAELSSGGSYASQHDFSLHFGVAAASDAQVEVTWLGGETERLGTLAAGALYRVKEGAGVTAREPWRSR